MILFPLDNTEYEASALGAWCGTRTRGVFSGGSHFLVSANGDMTVTVNPGIAWLKADTYWGVSAFESNPQVLTIDTADGALTRIDLVCIRLDKNRNLGELILKKGSYSPQPPVIPAPIRNLDYDEIFVAAVMVRAGATEIIQGDISDLRLNETYCGIMRDGVTGIPTQQLYDEWFGWFSALKIDAENKANAFVQWIEMFKVTASANFDDWFSAFKDENSRIYALWYNAFITDSETTFNDWFADLRNTLDENQAANLFNKIDTHERTNVSDDSINGVHGVRVNNDNIQIRLPKGWATIGRLPIGYTAEYFNAQNFTAQSFDIKLYTAEKFDNIIRVEE